MGFGLVLATSICVAYFSNMLIPGFTLALGFLLGGIVSPPDAVAATSVLKGVNIPRRGLAILEGESLVNDAASLTVFRFALAAVLTGQFVLKEAVNDFLILTVMGILVGLVIAQVLYLILRYLAKASNMTTPITFIAPYIMYLTAESFEYSGVLAVVSGGLMLSYRSKDFFNYQTRLQAYDVWETIIFLLNGFVFILIGLELPVVVAGLGDYSFQNAVTYTLWIAGIAILLRILLVYLSAFLPRLISKRVRGRENSPGYKLPFIIGWAGMRGVVSLASALAIPLTLNSHESFPHRNLILFITFGVILITLVFQGLTLPLFIRLLKIEDSDKEIPESEQIDLVQLDLLKASISYLDRNYPAEVTETESINRIREQLMRSMHSTRALLNASDEKESISSGRQKKKEVLLELVGIRRQRLNELRHSRRFSDEVIRHMEHNMDLEEARLQLGA